MKGQCTGCDVKYDLAERPCQECGGHVVWQSNDVIKLNEQSGRDGAEIVKLMIEVKRRTDERNDVENQLFDLAERIADVAPKERPVNHSGPFLEWDRIGRTARGILNRRARSLVADKTGTEK